MAEEIPYSTIEKYREYRKTMDFRQAAATALGFDKSKPRTLVELDVVGELISAVSKIELSEDVARDNADKEAKKNQELDALYETYTFTEAIYLDYRNLLSGGMGPRTAAATVLGNAMHGLGEVMQNDIEALIHKAGKEALSMGCVTTNQVRADRMAFDHDPVNHPRHYTQYKGLEIIDLTEQMNFNLGNAVKYIARAGFKDADKTIEDLEKAVWYTQREIERLKKEAE